MSLIITVTEGIGLSVEDPVVQVITVEMGPPGVPGADGAGSPSDGDPEPLGVAGPGTSDETSRADHVHPMPSAADVGAAAAVHTHDDRYYTESEADTLLGAKASKAANLGDLTNAATARTNLGLGNVTNTSDASKPVSVAQQAALDAKADLVGGVVPSAQIPAIAITDFLGSVASQVAMLALVGQKGDWAIRTDLGTTWVITGSDPTQLASWTALAYPTAPVLSVNGETGAVTLSAADVGAEASGAVAAHSADTTGVHGIVDTSALVLTDDARLSDARLASDATVSQVDAEAGTATDRRIWTAQRVKQAIHALVGPLIAGWTGKTTPVDADTIPLTDSAAAGAPKTLTWANLKATLKTYFDTLYTGDGETLIGYNEDFDLESTAPAAWPDANAVLLEFEVQVPASGDIEIQCFGFTGVVPDSDGTLLWAITDEVPDAETEPLVEKVALYVEALLTSRSVVPFVLRGLTPGPMTLYWVHRQEDALTALTNEPMVKVYEAQPEPA